MAETPKKQPGRPKKSPLEKQGQFSIRLPFLPKIILEAIARHRGVSLSQAVEFAVIDLGARYKIGGKPVIEVVTEGFRKMAARASNSSPVGENRNDFLLLAERLNETTKLLSQSEAGRIFLLPDETRSPEEKFFVEVIGHCQELSVIDADAYLPSVLAMFNAGMTVENAVALVKGTEEDLKERSDQKE